MMLDVFKGDAFSFTELVKAINLIPYAPTRLGQMGLFTSESISTLTVAIEMQQGVLTLVPAAPRGARGPAKNVQKRNVRDFRPVHLPQTVSVLADEVQGIRVFGSQSETETAMALLNKKMVIARRDLDLTHEFQRMGALKGNVLDADGSTVLYNYFTEFGVTQQTMDFNLDVDTTKVRGKCTSLERLIEDTLGGVMMSGIGVLASPEFFDAFVDHPAVVDTFKYTNGQPLRDNQRMRFEFGGLQIEEYRGTVNGTRFIAANKAYAFPLGVPDLFTSYFAPADYMDTVNTMGLPFYMKGRSMDFDRGLEYEVQSNPLHICTRPNAVIELSI
jgi:Phage major capsid protein E